MGFSGIAARTILRQEFGTSTNLMTPEVLKVGKVHHAVAFELSEGTGFGRDAREGGRGAIFGVTFAGHDGAGQTYRAVNGWSRVFGARHEALNWIDTVASKLTGLDSREAKALLTTEPKEEI